MAGAQLDKPRQCRTRRVVYTVIAILVVGAVTGLAVSRGTAQPEKVGPSVGDAPPMSDDVAPRFSADWWHSDESVCPPGTRFFGALPPDGYEAWCAADDRTRQGPHVRWHTSGRKAFEGHYVDGLLHGRVTEWWASGQRMREGVYERGLREGAWTRWTRDGVVAERITHGRGLP